MTTQPATATRLNSIDEFIASRLIEMFSHGNGDSGWNLINNGIFADGAQQDRVIDELLRREVLYRCDYCRSTMSTTPIVCDCQDIADEADDAYDLLDDDQRHASSGEVYDRAYLHFGGSHEMAREAASMYPGDFI